MPILETHTLVDCACKAKVYSDGSGVDIEYCEIHAAAFDLHAAVKHARSLLAESRNVGNDREKAAMKAEDILRNALLKTRCLSQEEEFDWMPKTHLRGDR